MRLTVSDPRALPSLIAALRKSDCIAHQVGPRKVDVYLRDDEARQAPVELRFFARAWAAAHTGVRVTVG